MEIPIVDSSNHIDFYVDGNMEPWVKASNQTEYMIRSSDILTTIADPTPEVVEAYLKLTEYRMRFYTNVQMVGDHFLVRGYENGQTFHDY